MFGGSDGKESACSMGDLGLICGLGRSPGEQNGYPCQSFCLENPMERGTWWATAHGIAESDMAEELTLSLSFWMGWLQTAYGWMASLTQWTWVWANFGREWTGKPGVLQSMGLQIAGHDLAAVWGITEYWNKCEIFSSWKKWTCVLLNVLDINNDWEQVKKCL